MSPEAHGALAHHFDDLEQQHEAAALGMWAFLVTEIMFFGGLFTGYAVYRHSYPQAWAQGSHHLSILWGGFNTAVLLGSSLTMALAVRSAQVNQQRDIVRYLLATIGLGVVFLGVKAIEYAEKFAHHLVPGLHFHAPQDAPQMQLFFSFYFAMTGVHALHMVIGIGILATLLWMARRGRFSAEHHPWLELSGLYWHLVDIVWIFLFPLLYLIDRHGS
ncbi:MAG: cytochrome c oxidase subunit 3 family protein [Planctomycetota bacterium]